MDNLAEYKHCPIYLEDFMITAHCIKSHQGELSATFQPRCSSSTSITVILFIFYRLLHSSAEQSEAEREGGSHPLPGQQAHKTLSRQSRRKRRHIDGQYISVTYWHYCSATVMTLINFALIITHAISCVQLRKTFSLATRTSKNDNSDWSF